MLNPDLILSPPVSIDELAKMAADSADVLEQVRDKMLEPFPRKQAPSFSIPQVAALCGVDRVLFKHLARKHDLPIGDYRTGEKSRSYASHRRASH